MFNAHVQLSDYIGVGVVWGVDYNYNYFAVAQLDEIPRNAACCTNPAKVSLKKQFPMSFY